MDINGGGQILKLSLTHSILETCMGTLSNREDSNEMQHNVVFHQGLHCLLRLKQPTGTEIPDKPVTQMANAINRFSCNSLAHLE